MEAQYIDPPPFDERTRAAPWRDQAPHARHQRVPGSRERGRVDHLANHHAYDVWAIGTHGATIHWDAERWATVFSDFDQPINAVAGWSATDVWAVSNTDQGTNTILHWNGEQWTQIDRTPHEPLAAVWAVGPGEAWVSGWWATLLHHLRTD